MTSVAKVAIGNNYKDMLYALPGNFNGAVNNYQHVNTPVQSVAFLFGIDDPTTPAVPDDKCLAIYTLESRGYHTSNIANHYYDQDVVNQQEGLSLYNDSTDHQAYTYHPTVWRFDQSVMRIPITQIKAAVSGDFTGDGQDEIALLVKDSTGQKVIIIRCYNYFGEALNYTVFAYSPMSVSTTTLDFDNIKFACSGHYTEQHSKIAVLYDNKLTGNQEIYTFEPASPWHLDLQYSQPKSTFDIDNVRFVASGLFEHGSPTPRMAICYDDVATNTEKVYITRDYGNGWVLDERFSKPRSQFDFNKVRQVVAGAFDDVAGDDELAMFYDHGNDATGLGSVQQVLLTTHDTPWNTMVAINEKRSAMDFDNIRHAYAANLDYNAGPRRDEIGVVYNDNAGATDNQRYKSEKVFVYTNKPPFSENNFTLDANVQPFDVHGDPVGSPDYRPFFPLGWFGVPLDSITTLATRGKGAYNTLWLGATVPHTNLADIAGWEKDYQDYALHLGFHTIREARSEVYDDHFLETLVNQNNVNSLLAWCTVDEPDGRAIPLAAVTANNDVVRNAGGGPLMPIMSGEKGSEFYREECDVLSLDGYPYYPGNDFTTAPVLAPLRSALYPHRTMESAIRYNKPALIFAPQGTRVHEDGYSGPERTPTFEEIRYNSFAPVVEGARGLIYYTFSDPNMNVEPVRRRVDLIAQEMAHYIPALVTQSLTGRVTIDKHGFVPADFDRIKDGLDRPSPIRLDFNGGTSRYMSLLTYTLHHDPNSNRYYLFVVNNWSLPVEDVELTAFGVPETVSYLPAEYFQNGHYVPMNARVDHDGGYVTFHDSFKGNEVKVYAIGDLPAVVPPADATVQTFQGDLSFSNQRKLVASPTVPMLNANDPPDYTDDIYYHLVYHRLDPLTNRSKVYYRRSKLTSRTAPMETVEWEPWEMRLSDNIIDGNQSAVTSVSCVHPSIVVRYDAATGVNKAYVVFNCYGGPEAPNGYIVESILAADATYTPPIVAPQANAITTYIGRNTAEWGTPMINASSNGNYYVWADSLSGIKAGWKRPQDIGLQSTTSIHWNASEFAAQHPSLNSYSHLADAEDNCALVWQESSGAGSPDIYYTRLRGDLTGIAPYLPTNSPNGVANPVHSNTIARLTDPVQGSDAYNHMPMVYRCEEVGQAGGHPDAGATLRDLDRVYWETLLIPTGNVSTPPKWQRYGLIGHRALDFNDRWAGTRWETNTWGGWPARWIWSSSRNLSQPNVAQGAMSNGGAILGSDHAVNLNFTSTNPLTLATSIWNVPHGYNTMTLAATGDNLVNAATLTYAEEIPGPATNPQLAALPRLRPNPQPGPHEPVALADDWFRNQRVFNSGTANSIVASRTYFVKSALADLKPCPLVGFGNASGFSLVSPFLLDGGAIPFALPQWDSASTNPPDPGDTVRTAWFTVGSRQQLEFALLGKTVTSGVIGGGSPRTELWIERKLTGARMQIALPAGDDVEGVPVACSLVNGADEEYRLLVVNREATSQYTEHLVLDGLPVSDTVHADSSALHKGSAGSGLDLGLLRGGAMAGGATLAVYPNPATDKVVVTLGGGSGVLRTGGTATLTITSALGTVVDRREIAFMRGVELDVAGLANGVYFVNVGTREGSLATASFVIQR